MNQSNPKVSVIIATHNQLNLLPRIIKCYKNQTWENKELLIFDDLPGTAHFTKDLQEQNKDIHIFHSKDILSNSKKHELLIKKSSGDLVAHFEACNYYAPRYLETLIKTLLTSRANLVKLAGWFCFHEASNTLGYWDTTRHDLPNHIFTGAEQIGTKKSRFSSEQNQSFRNECDFSCIYRKSILKNRCFKDISNDKDIEFLPRIFSEAKKVAFAQDNSGLCLQIIYKSSRLKCFPNHIIAEAHKEKYFPFLKQKNTTDNTGKTANSNIKPSNPLVYCTTKNNWGKSSPTISICTITHNRRPFLQQLQKCVESQDYPMCNLEWVILDDSTDYQDVLEFRTETDLRIKYQRVKHKLPLGRKRNLSHQLCSGDYIIYMDDDDYYPPSRVSHAVSSLQESGKDIAGSTLLQIYFCHDKQLWLSGPFGPNHATAGTFAMTKDFARHNHYRNEDMCNEEKYFLRNYTIPMAQLDPYQTMICISHASNTFDKKRMRAKGATRTMQQLNKKKLSREVLSKLQKYESIHARTKT